MQAATHWTTSCLALALSLAVPTTALAQDDKGQPSHRVAIVGLGTDAVRVKDLQGVMERRLASVDNVEALDELDVARQVGANDPAASIPANGRKRMKKLLTEVEEAYYQDKLKQALKLLDTLEQLQDRYAGTPIDQRVLARLWRAAVFVSMKNKQKAGAAARSALTLDPKLRMNPDLFSPTVARAVEAERKKGLRSVNVTVEGLPRVAVIKVDDRPVGRTFAVPAGKHFLEVEVDGMRRVYRTFDAPADTTVSVATKLNLGLSMTKGLEGIVWSGKTNARDDEGLRELSRRLNVNGLILIATRTKPVPEHRAYLWTTEPGTSRASPPMSGSEQGARALADFVAVELERATPGPLPGPGPGPTPTPMPTPGPRVAKPFMVEARAGAGVTSRTRAISASGGAGYTGDFVGAGPTIQIDASRGGIVVGLEASTVFYGLSPVTVNHPSGTGNVDVGGGLTLAGWLGAGYRLTLGGGWLAAMAGGFYEQHDSEDVQQAGTDLGLFTGYTRTGIDGRLSAGTAIPGLPLSVRGLFGVSTLNQWKEARANTTGASPKPGFDLLWRGGADWNPTDAWRVSLEYTGESRQVTFSGDSSIPIDPPITNATLKETLHTGAVVIQRSF